ncbi:MAG: cell division protein FtsL [Burkholderiaceae bacterium]|nr:cell division protein FtsL [Burkholderiaceae bacterium]
MARLAILLLVAVVVSALYVVRVQYQSRQLYTALDHATRDAQQLDADHERLEVEKRAAATSLRVEQIAHNKLAMRPITPAITDYVTLPASPQVSAASGARQAASAAGGAP